MYPVSSVPLALFYPNVSLSAPTTPIAIEAMRTKNHQPLKYFQPQPGTPGWILHAQGGKLEQKNHNAKYQMKFEPSVSLPIMVTPTANNSNYATSSLSTGVYMPSSMAVVPYYPRSAPAGSNTYRPQLPSKDTSAVKNAFQKRPISLDVTPKRRTERRSAQHFRRQQQSDVVNFAGAKFSESPEAKVVPLPPFLWCEEASSSSSCSGDEPTRLSITEVIKVRHGKIHETPKWNKCSPSLQVTPLPCVAVLPSS
ncbi:hypothetical protein X798_00048 [Onchocerca flexuosa]|uniref:Uncharacterized protein n=1 Tax=Onchocerca flexuosa TaxID=387005 RepID=A0A238C4L9_9BILA|nr:hypothetical protein X798_00048 [Onchocerca flexuosa]